MNKTSRTYTLPEVLRLIRGNFVVAGVPVDEELVSSQGIRFTIIHYPLAMPYSQLKSAEIYLKSQRDVVRPIMVAEMESCPNCGSTEEEVGFYLDGAVDNYHLICNGCNHSWKSESYHDPKDYS